MLYLSLAKSTNISLATGTQMLEKKKEKLTEIHIKLIPGFMHRRAYIKDPTSRPRVIQIQLFGSDDNIPAPPPPHLHQHPFRRLPLIHHQI
jgi:hypothetical protein